MQKKKISIFSMPQEQTSDEKIKLLEQQAKKRKGYVRTGVYKFADFPSNTKYLIFQHDGIGVSVTNRLMTDKTLAITIVKAKFKKKLDLKLDIYRRDENLLPSTKTIKLLTHKIKTGNADFDKMFKIKGNKDELIVEILDKNIQKKIIEIFSYYPLIEIYKNKLVLVIQDIIHDEKEYDKLINLAIILLDRLKLLDCIGT